jgi:hypothetical protein
MIYLVHVPGQGYWNPQLFHSRGLVPREEAKEYTDQWLAIDIKDELIELCAYRPEKWLGFDKAEVLCENKV